ncbi:MAG: DUF4251 domain-containing protein [Flavobacteriaceae bacterium]|nr:MAG: DUF4251 domain-containing protein [Flavobacteriaceae bacterium]
MKIVHYNLLFLLLLSSSSLLGQSKKEKKEKKVAQKNEAYKATKKLIDSGNYLFDAQTTNSPSINQGVISLESKKNSVIVKEEVVELNLPYFGVASSYGYGYNNSNPGISYKGIPAEYNVEHIDKKRRSVIKIKVTSSMERHDITLTVNYRRKTEVKVISSSRQSVSFSGYLMPLEINSNK